MAMGKTVKQYLADNMEWIVIGGLLQVKATQVAGITRRGLGGEILVMLGVLVIEGFIRDVYSKREVFCCLKSRTNPNKKAKTTRN